MSISMEKYGSNENPQNQYKLGKVNYSVVTESGLVDTALYIRHMFTTQITETQGPEERKRKRNE